MGALSRSTKVALIGLPFQSATSHRFNESIMEAVKTITDSGAGANRQPLRGFFSDHHTAREFTSPSSPQEPAKSILNSCKSDRTGVTATVAPNQARSEGHSPGAWGPRSQFARARRTSLIRRQLILACSENHAVSFPWTCVCVEA